LLLIAVCPGSFDPVTCGHLDIITRASRCFDHLYVAVFENKEKPPLLSMDERLVDFCRKHGAKVIVKGLRAVSDFDYEFKMALMNKKLAPEVETVFMMTSLKYLYLSSSLVKEVLSYGGCIKGLVPSHVEKRLIELAESGKPAGQ